MPATTTCHRSYQTRLLVDCEDGENCAPIAVSVAFDLCAIDGIAIDLAYAASVTCPTCGRTILVEEKAAEKAAEEKIEALMDEWAGDAIEARRPYPY